MPTRNSIPPRLCSRPVWYGCQVMVLLPPPPLQCSLCWMWNYRVLLCSTHSYTYQCSRYSTGPYIIQLNAQTRTSAVSVSTSAAPEPLTHAIEIEKKIQKLEQKFIFLIFSFLGFLAISLFVIGIKFCIYCYPDIIEQAEIKFLIAKSIFTKLKFPAKIIFLHYFASEGHSNGGKFHTSYE